MTDMILLHHTSCGTSRKGKALLEENGVVFTERRYLNKDQTLSRDELIALQEALGAAHPSEFMRVKDVEKFGKNAREMSEDAAIELLLDNPKLMQRPILWSGSKAILGRPPEKMLNLVS